MVEGDDEVDTKLWLSFPCGVQSDRGDGAPEVDKHSQSQIQCTYYVS